MMKKLLLFFVATFVCFTVTNCSEIPENNDPIIGIWSKTQLSESGQQLSKKEWIFNDAYKGRYHQYTNDNVAFFTDFQWEIDIDDVYTISYPGTDMENDIVTMTFNGENDSNTDKSSSSQPSETDLLKDSTGKVLALRD